MPWDFAGILQVVLGELLLLLGKPQGLLKVFVWVVRDSRGFCRRRCFAGVTHVMLWKRGAAKELAGGL